MKFLKILGRTADVAELIGTATGNPYLKLGGAVVQEIVKSDDDTEEYLKELSKEELENLLLATQNEINNR